MDRSHERAVEGEAAAVWVAVEKLIPWVKNPRKNDASVDKACASIKAHGWGAPLLARRDNQEIIAGHTRLKAALRMGLKVVPVRYLDLDEIRAHSLALADNRVGEDSEWDKEALARVLEELKAGGADMEATAFEKEEVDDLIARLEAERLAEVTEDLDEDLLALPEKPVSIEGEVYLLGPHVLVCGDSTRMDHVQLALGEAERVDMMWTDPPYNVGYEGKTKEKLTIENDKQSLLAFTDFLRDAFASAMAVCKPGAVWYVAAPPGPDSLAFSTNLHALGVWRQMIVWAKDVFVLGHSDYHYKFESIFYGWTPGGSHLFTGDRTQDNVWEVPRPKASRVHPTMKPVELIARAIRNSSRTDDHVLDLFGGSGSTLIACAKERRIAHLVELDPKYCDVIRRRWARFALKAGLEVGDGLVGEQKAAAEPEPLSPLRRERVLDLDLPEPLHVGGDPKLVN
jgi:DNA modification methylase